MTRLSPVLLVPVAAATLTLASSWPAAAQSAWGGARIQSYAMTDADAVRIHDVRLRSIPFGGRAPLTSWATLSLAGAHADALLTLPNGDTGRLSGITDTRVELDGSWRSFKLTGTAVLPSGTVVRDTEEATVVGLLASELLPFSVTHWGTGGAYGADLAYSFGLGRARVTVSAGHLAVSESTPLDGSTEETDPLGGGASAYQPGSQTRARLVADAQIGDASVLSALLGFQTFGTDVYDEQNLFSPGTRVEGLLSYAFPVGSRESAVVFGGYYHRSAGALVWSLATPPELGDVLPGASASVSRQLFVAGSELRISRRRFELAPRVEGRVLRSAEGFGQGWLASIGGAAAYRLVGERFGSKLLVESTVDLHRGRLVPREGAESGVVGWSAGLTLRWERGG